MRVSNCHSFWLLQFQMNFAFPAWFCNAYPESVKGKVAFIQQMPLTNEEAFNLRTGQLACLSSAVVGAFVGQRFFSIAKIQSNHKAFRTGFALCGSMTFLALACSITHTMLKRTTGQLAQQLHLLDLQLLAQNSNTPASQSALINLFE